jgi:hypothetical protein
VAWGTTVIATDITCHITFIDLVAFLTTSVANNLFACPCVTWSLVPLLISASIALGCRMASHRVLETPTLMFCSLIGAFILTPISRLSCLSLQPNTERIVL